MVPHFRNAVSCRMFSGKVRDSGRNGERRTATSARLLSSLRRKRPACSLSKLRRGSMWKHLQLGAVALCIALSTSGQAATPTSPEPYRLGVDDKLRIRVYEWRNSVGEVHEWSALTDEF